MKIKMLLLLNLAVVFLIGAAVGSISAQDVARLAAKPQANIQIVRNVVHSGGRSEIKSRNIYVYVDEKDFSKEAIGEIFAKIESEFCDPYDLGITLYSSEEMLRKRMDFDEQPHTIYFSSDQEGQAAKARFYAKAHPPLSGYFRATYHRYGDYELFDYSPNKDAVETVRVDLKDMPTATGGKKTKCKPSPK